MDFTNEETYRLTRLPVQLAHTLNPEAYRSSEYYRLEQERVFGRSWVCVGYTSQVKEPGDSFVSMAGTQSLLFLRDQKKQLRGFYNVCRHRGSQLVEKDGKLNIIRCPYHAWGYNLEGKLLGTPYFKGLDVPETEQRFFDTSETREFSKEDYGLLQVKVDTWGCFVFANLDPAARPLSEWLGDLPERYQRYPLNELECMGRKKFEINANWKLIAENFMEYYHLPWVHPELTTVSGVTEHHRQQGPGMYTGMDTSPLTQNPESALSAELPTMPGLNEREAKSAYWIFLFPNIALFLMPNHLFTLLLRPNGIGHTVESADLLIHPSVYKDPLAPEKLKGIYEYWDMVNRQDILAVERVHRGLQTQAYPGGRMCFHFEEPIHRFQNMVIDLMTGRSRIPEGDGANRVS
jgi:choline monooxygenase